MALDDVVGRPPSMVSSAGGGGGGDEQDLAPPFTLRLAPAGRLSGHDNDNDSSGGGGDRANKPPLGRR